MPALWSSKRSDSRDSLYTFARKKAKRVLKKLSGYTLSALRQSRSRYFLRNVMFVFLPFRASFAVTILFRYLTALPVLDNYFVFFCGPHIPQHLGWIQHSGFSKKYANEVIFYLLLCNLPKEATKLAPWYIDLLSDLHKVNWQNAGLKETQLRSFVRLMLEHRNYDLEDNLFNRSTFPDVASTMPLIFYIPEFFRDKELVHRLVSELELSGAEKFVEVRARMGVYWKQIPANRLDHQLAADIHLFYAYRHLLLRAYHAGEGHYVPLIYRKSIEVQKRLRCSLPKPSAELQSKLDEIGLDLTDVKLFSPDWSGLIGHNGHLNVHLMMRRMGWWRGSPLLLAYDARIANEPFLSLFSELCPTLTLGKNVSPEVWHELASLVPFLSVSHQAFAFEDGRAMYWNDAGAMALNKWESEGKGYPLREIYDRRLARDDRPKALFTTLRKHWGLADDDWYVCLHIRDSETRGERDGVGESVRSASFSNYLEAIRYITEAGGWVIRMGSEKAPALPEMRRVIDYARSRLKSPEMDIHLVRNAKMFIGTTSGFAYVASSFGIPMAMVNALSSIGLLWTKDTRFALKRVYTHDRRLLSFREMTSEEWRWTFPTQETTARAGLTIFENTPDEILGTVKEVLDLSLQEGSVDTGLSDDVWKKNMGMPEFFGSARPSRYFFEKYSVALSA